VKEPDRDLLGQALLALAMGVCIAVMVYAGWLMVTGR
jgi:hypothetical protein